MTYQKDHMSGLDSAKSGATPGCSGTWQKGWAVPWPSLAAPGNGRMPTLGVRFEMMDDFTATEIRTGENDVFVLSGGSGPPILLLHGFPQTHLMWRDVAPLLASDFTVVCADLRGYGRSGCLSSAPDHAPYSKRVMAREMVVVMERLGFGRFSVAGHDRGGRVAYRMAFDHPDRVDRLAVLDVLPTETVWERADARFALSYWPWSDHAHAICEEYRAAATIDREHDRADLASGRRIVCPLLALWSAEGALDAWYVEDGGPPALWQAWADDVRGHALDAGHFFPEEAPQQTADALNRFFGTTQ